MQVVILAGGKGTRITEETRVVPKPMIEIGNTPILVHIMRYFASYGHRDFLIALGYKGSVIKEYFANYLMLNSDLYIQTRDGKVSLSLSNGDDWKINLVETGSETLTGGRLKRLASHLDETFFLTYGDGLSDVNLDELYRFHCKSESVATVTAVHPPARFGALEISDDYVSKFSEKSLDHAGWINGGYFVCSRELVNYLHDDGTILETGPMTELVEKRQLKAFRHEGFWHPLDSVRDKLSLEELFAKGETPWIRDKK